MEKALYLFVMMGGLTLLVWLRVQIFNISKQNKEVMTTVTVDHSNDPIFSRGNIVRSKDSGYLVIGYGFMV